MSDNNPETTLAANKTDPFSVDAEWAKKEAENATGSDTLEVALASVKIGSNAENASEWTAEPALLLEDCLDKLSCRSTPDLTPDFHKGVTVHACTTDGETWLGTETKTTLLGKAHMAIEAGHPTFSFKAIVVPIRGLAGHAVVSTKNAGDRVAGDITILVGNGVKEFSFGHCKVSFTAPRGSHFTESKDHD